jgi:hypothetical protein
MSFITLALRKEKEKHMKSGCFDRRKHMQQRCSRPQNPFLCPFFSRSSPLVGTPTGDAFVAIQAPLGILFPLHTLRGWLLVMPFSFPFLKPVYSFLSKDLSYHISIEKNSFFDSNRRSLLVRTRSCWCRS